MNTLPRSVTVYIPLWQFKETISPSKLLIQRVNEAREEFMKSGGGEYSTRVKLEFPGDRLEITVTEDRALKVAVEGYRERDENDDGCRDRPDFDPIT